MDKNTVIGFVLIFALLGGYMWYNQPTKEQLAAQKRQQDSIAIASKFEQEHFKEPSNIADSTDKKITNDSLKKALTGSFVSSQSNTEIVKTLENDVVKVTLSSKGGRIISIELKNYKTFDGKPLLLATEKTFSQGIEFYTKQNMLLNTNDFEFNDIEGNNNSISFTAKSDSGGFIKQAYTLKHGSYMVDYDITLQGMDKIIPANNSVLGLSCKAELIKQEQNRDNENLSTTVYYHYATDDYDKLDENKSEEVKPATSIKWFSFKQRFFNISLLNKEEFSDVKFSQKKSDSLGKLKSMTAYVMMPFNHTNQQTYHLQWYIGPNKYNELKSLNIGLEKIITLGGGIFKWVKYLNQYVIIPIFNFFDGYHIRYGYIILILVLIFRLILFPLNFKTFSSAAKMRIIKPEIDELRAKYKDDQAKFGQEQMKLYRRAGVSPLGGCLPQLMQIPIFVSMYYFYPSSIELRQQAWLWSPDLSNFDSILNLGFSIPGYGSHISLFTLLMTATTYVTMYLNRNQMNMNSDPNMKAMQWIQYVFPIMLLGVFNNSPAALSYYYLLQNLTAIAQQFIIQKFVIDEKKLHLQIEENKKRPEKKSGWQQRLDEAYKMREQQNKKGKR